MLTSWILLIALVSLSIADPEEVEDVLACSNSVSPGAFSYSVGGASQTGNLIQAGGANSWGPVTVSGNKITVGLGPRFYLANTCATSFGNGVFGAWKLLGATIQYTVNVNNLGCGLNWAFYLVSMPAPGATSNGDYYCDANCVGGYCCAEMDLMEANKHALTITPHRCTSGTSGCDAGGCSRNTQSISKGYGPGTGYKINTNNDFTIKTTFTGSNGVLTGITSVISQGSNSITLTHGSECGSNYLSDMGKYINAGMVPVWSYWKGNMAWLDSPACSNENPEVQGNAVISNIIITGGSVIKAPGSPTPAPVAPAKPNPPGTLQCGQSGTSNNQYWIEFKAPSGVTGSSTSASVACNEGTYTCSWFSAGNKYQCSATKGCTNPKVTVGGKSCQLVAGLLVSDSSATGDMADQKIIIGVSVAAAMVVIIIVLSVVVWKMKNNHMEKV